MSDSKPQNDPSMDDILASIRKIISDDEARAAAPPPKPADEPSSDDVLLLTELIEEPPGTPTVKVEPVLTKDAKASSPPISGITPIPSPPKPTVMDIDAPQPATVSTPAAPPRPPVGVAPPVTTSSPVSPVSAMSISPTSPSLSPKTSGMVSAAFERLSRSVVDTDPEPPVVAAPVSSSSSGGKTIEDLVREMLKPALQEWMDKNLPDMVEKMVEREIARMARR